MLADRLLSTARLSAWRSGIFALTSAMTHLLTEVIAASEFLVAGQTTSNLGEPTRLILQCLLSANARLLN